MPEPFSESNPAPSSDSSDPRGFHWSFFTDFRHHPWVVTLEVAFLVAILAGGVHRWNKPLVILSCDGVMYKLHPKAATVAEVLHQQHIVLGPHDFVSPPAQSELARHNQIVVTRVTYTRERQIVKTPLTITERAQLKSNLRPVQVEKGYWNEETLTVQHELHDGKEVSQSIIKKTTKKHPTLTLTLFKKNSTYPGKVYDLTKVPTLKVLATAYYVGDPMVPSDTTYLGFKLRRGLVAVDPTVIPLRSRLYIKGYGYAYAADTGSAIKGLRIDLAVKDKYEEVRFNHRHMTVYILGKNKDW